MSNSFATKLLFLGTMTAVFLVTGCTSDKRAAPPETSNSQAIMTAGNANDPNDPVAMHLAARAQVDPKDTSTHHAYTTTPTEEEVNRDTNIRIVRLENEVTGMRNDFKKLMPNISSESAEAIQQEQMASNAQPVTISPKPLSNPPDERMAADPAPMPAPQPQEIMPASGNATSSITGVRIGQHPDKTRIVLDMDGPGKFSYNLDNNQNVLMVQLPESAWTGAVQESLSTDPLVAGYEASRQPNGGFGVAIQLKKPAKVTMSSALEPNEVYGHRIVFDVAPL